MSRIRNIPRSTLVVALLLALSWSSPRSEGGPDELGSGPLGLADLIALGLKNDPALIAKRGEIPIAEARKRAERDWPDPQVRFRRTWGFNDVPPSYTERRVENYDQHVKRTEIDEEGKVVESTELERVQRTTDRRITPGRERTTIEERFRESSRETREIPLDPNSAADPGTSFDNRSISRAGTETRFHEFDPFASEDDLAVQLRLYVPHPRIRRARIERAQHEINLARAEAKAEEREVVLEIRELYEELQYLKMRVELLKGETEAAEDYDEVQNQLLDQGLITIDKIEFVDRDPLAAEIAQSEFEALRDRLAARVGLGLEQGSRIRVTDRLISPAVNLNHTHLQYLIEMAFANRQELVTVNGQGRIAESDLKEAKAKNIPWFEYFQAEFGRDERNGEQTGTSWGVQFAMSLPVFTWLGHEKEIYEAAVASYFAQKEANEGVITGEVAAAYRNVQRASKLRGRARANSVAQKERNDGFLGKLEGMNRLKYEETRYDISRATSRGDRYRLDAERSYNRALLELEKAIGAPLDRIFDGSSGGGSGEATAPALPAEPVRPLTPPKDEEPTPGEEATEGSTPMAAPVASEGSKEKRSLFDRWRPPRRGGARPSGKGRR